MPTHPRLALNSPSSGSPRPPSPSPICKARLHPRIPCAAGRSNRSAELPNCRTAACANRERRWRARPDNQGVVLAAVARGGRRERTIGEGGTLPPPPPRSTLWHPSGTPLAPLRHPSGTPPAHSGTPPAPLRHPSGTLWHPSGTPPAPLLLPYRHPLQSQCVKRPLSPAASAPPGRRIAAARERRPSPAAKRRTGTLQPLREVSGSTLFCQTAGNHQHPLASPIPNTPCVGEPCHTPMTIKTLMQ
jgi:hypothetical protein